MNRMETIFGDMDKDVFDKKWNLVIYYMEPILEFFEDDSITEIMVNRWDTIFVEKEGKLVLTDAKFKDQGSLRALIEQIGKTVNQPIDEEYPILHASFPDQSRLCCTLSNVTPKGDTITLRCVPSNPITAQDLIDYQSLNKEMMDFIRKKVEEGANILISGNTGSGKTSLLRVISGFIPSNERVITCEDTLELFIKLDNVVSHEAPKRRADKNADLVRLSNLVETALRERPDRLLVGEIRDGFAADAFLQAINTGHSGCCTTLHANSCLDALDRLQYIMASEGLVSYDLARKLLLGSLDVLVQVSRDPTFGRKVTEIYEVKSKKPERAFYFDERSRLHIKDDGLH